MLKAGCSMIKRLLLGGLAMLGMTSAVALATETPASLMARYGSKG